MRYHTTIVKRNIDAWECGGVVHKNVGLSDRSAGLARESTLSDHISQ